MISCKFCKKDYIGRNKNKDVLIHESHCILNIDRVPYICNICNKEFDKRHSLIGHKSHCGNLKVRKKRIKKEKVIKIHKCKYCDSIFENGYKLGGHVSHCEKDPEYETKKKKMCDNISYLNKGKKLSDETRKKISNSRREYLKNNPDKVPYLLNHSRNESYPEKYFTDVFLDRNISVIKSYRIRLYELDFCILDKKIDIEIDGGQHYLDNKIIESDKRRNKYLEDLGWDIIRIKWSDYQLLDKDSKREFIDNIIYYINGLVKTKPTFEILDNKNYCKCGIEIYKCSKMCSKCDSFRQRKVERPSLEQILKDIEETNYVLTGKKYGVSDNTIRKWIRQYNADLAETV